MSRIAYLRNHPKKSLSALATLLLATGLTAGSGAYFSDSSAVDSNSVASGTLDIATYGSGAPENAPGRTAPLDASQCDEERETNYEIRGQRICQDAAARFDPDGDVPVIKVANLAPSAYAIRRNFRVCNKGSLPARLRASAVNVSGSPALRRAVEVDVDRLDAGGYNVVSNVMNDQPVNALDNAVIDQGADGTREQLAAGECFTYGVTVRLPDSQRSQNSLQGLNYGFDVRVDAKTLGAAFA